MRLVDADKVREYIAFTEEILIDEMPTIEAIPIEWIQQRIEHYKLLKNYDITLYYYEVLEMLLDDWREENE